MLKTPRILSRRKSPLTKRTAKTYRCPGNGGQTDETDFIKSPPMMWADVIEQNLNRLRRYAALASGAAAQGDTLVEVAAERLIRDGIPREAPCPAGAFRMLDRQLRTITTPGVKMSTFGGRWQSLSLMERRIALLISVEQFTDEDAAFIADCSVAEVRAALNRVQIRYSDRFPARFGIAGDRPVQRTRIVDMVREAGHDIIWNLGPDKPLGDELDPPSAIIFFEGTIGLGSQSGAFVSPLADILSRLNGSFRGPIVIAGDESTVSNRGGAIWRVRSDMLTDPASFRKTLSEALLLAS